MTDPREPAPPTRPSTGPGAAPYDEIADWYEREFLPRGFDADRDPIGVDHALRHVLGPGAGRLLELGCGTGIHAPRLHELGWDPVGIDLSAGMLHHARHRLAVARGDAARLPFPDSCAPAVLAAMVHTDMADYAGVLCEVHRVLMRGGTFVHIGVHPCFCGGFADRTDPETIVIRPGYRDSHWTTASYTDRGIRDKVGAEHRPVAWLLNAVIGAGLVVDEVAEGGAPTPTTLSLRAHKPSGASAPRGWGAS